MRRTQVSNPIKRAVDFHAVEPRGVVAEKITGFGALGIEGAFTSGSGESGGDDVKREHSRILHFRHLNQHAAKPN